MSTPEYNADREIEVGAVVTVWGARMEPSWVLSRRDGAPEYVLTVGSVEAKRTPKGYKLSKRIHALDHIARLPLGAACFTKKQALAALRRRVERRVESAEDRLASARACLACFNEQVGGA